MHWPMPLLDTIISEAPGYLPNLEGFTAWVYLRYQRLGHPGTTGEWGYLRLPVNSPSLWFLGDEQPYLEPRQLAHCSSIRHVVAAARLAWLVERLTPLVAELICQ